MTAQFSPPPAPLGLLTLDDWAALPEERVGHTELAEGVVIVSPSPTPRHQAAAARLFGQLEAQLSDGFRVYPAVDVIVEREPATVRTPDLVVVHADVGETGPIDAAQVVIAIELISPGSVRTDLVTKRSEYANAGIGHYWIVDRNHALLALRPTGDGYVEAAASTAGRFVTDTPVPLTLDLSRL